ncbi:hypothetical protein SAMN04488564_102573 [Lentzea waywayandensis]|uniref:Peptidase S8/S53 domain-containing protein n=1 Tax=Lentzea waywayandensis TaxID=84724 RepID=A0A1I6DGT4_9PSEU|nr:S8/S53 family peptidase [Lentzea waywayandensis]SFR04636.1 hypothetical protein SAMN04488564_102573 [Lentzea waywayandensis]
MDANQDQLVVDNHHLDVVRKVLGQLKIQDYTEDAIPEFDLTLLNLKHIGKPEDEPDWKRVSDLDPVLTEVRARLAGHSGGWTPTIGKNRSMTSTFGAYPQTKSQNFWDPERREAPVPPDTWLKGDAGTGVRVGLVDTRVYRHADLPPASITASPEDFSPKKIGDDCNFEEGHAVFTIGLILKNAPGATVVAHAALGDDGKAEAWKVVKKLAQFLVPEPADRVHLIVLASGCRTHDGMPPFILERAIERLSPHITVVAAAGNHGIVEGMHPDTLVTRNSPTWPAALPGVVAVGVPVPPLPFPEADPVPHYSPDVPWVTCTVAPTHGDTFVSTYLNSKLVKVLDGRIIDNLVTGYAAWRGTSCAAAVLGGAIAAKMPSTGMDAREALKQLIGTGGIKKFTWPAQPGVQA